MIIPRLARKDLNTPYLHVMVQGVNKEYIFYREEHIKKYLKIISENIEDCNFTIMAYCIMNNHAHFLVHTQDIYEFGKFMHNINLQYANYYNRIENRCGVLFRNRYRVEPIYNTKYLINCIKYIHNNPVNANMVIRSDDYKYSSYKDYITKTGCAKTKVNIELFGENCNYLKLFEQTFEKRFIDIDEKNEEVLQMYIKEGIREYRKHYQKSIVEIFSNREYFRELVHYLKEQCGLKYTEIQQVFMISKGTMEYFRKF